MPPQVPSVCGSISDIVIGLLTAPVCAALEVYLVNKELWLSQIPRQNAMTVTVVSIVLFPAWYVLYLVSILSSVFSLEWTRISKRTNRIIYEAQSTATGHLLRRYVNKTRRQR
jgi:hypothetical protein